MGVTTSYQPGAIISHDYKWIQSSVYASIPSNAVIGGNDVDGAIIYVGRSFHNGDMLVAKVIPSKHMAFISWRGEEISKTHFEVLCGDNLAWQHCYNHLIPENAVSCGKTALGQPVYIGRGHYEGNLTVGKVSSVHRALFIPFGGAERRLNSYEILVAQEKGAFGWSVPSDVKPPYPSVDSMPPIMSYPSAPTPYEPPPPYEMPAIPMPMPMPSATPTPTTTYIPPSVPSCTSAPYNYNSYSSTYGQYDTWMTASSGYAPPNAVHAGHDTDLSPILVCRAFHDGELTPGKAVPSRGCAFIPFNGEEIPKTHYEVLAGDSSKYHWVQAEDGNIAPGAVEAGRTANGEPLFVGRAHYCGSLTPGKINRSHQCMYLPFAGKERRVTRYEVLVRRDEFYKNQAMQMHYQF